MVSKNHENEERYTENGQFLHAVTVSPFVYVRKYFLRMVLYNDTATNHCNVDTN